MLAYNLTMFAIVAVCLAAIHFAFEKTLRKQVKRCLADLIVWMKEAWRGLERRGLWVWIIGS